MADGDPDLFVSAQPSDEDADAAAADAETVGADEVLESRRRELPGSRRARQVALGVVVLLAVTVLAVRAASGSGSSRPSASSTSPTPSTAVPAPAPVAVPIDEPHDGLTIEVPDHIGRTPDQAQYVLPTIEQPPRCPDVDDGLNGCTGTRFIPAPFLSAIRGLLPAARTSSSTTLVLRAVDAFTRDAVWSRHYEATGPNSTQLTVQIGTGDQTSTLGEQVVTYYQQTFVYSDYVASGRTIQVLVTAAKGDAPPLADVRRLARDPRLLALL